MTKRNEFNKHNQLKSNGKGSLINRGCFQPACEEKAAPLTPLILFSKVFSPEAMSALCSDAQLLHWPCILLLFGYVLYSHQVFAFYGIHFYMYIWNSTTIKELIEEIYKVLFSSWETFLRLFLKSLIPKSPQHTFHTALPNTVHTGVQFYLCMLNNRGLRRCNSVCLLLLLNYCFS